jgi:hypothetical protein
MHRYLWHSILAASVLGATSVALAQTAKETLPEPPAAQEQMQPPASGEAMPEVMPQSKSPR